MKGSSLKGRTQHKIIWPIFRQILSILNKVSKVLITGGFKDDLAAPI